MTCVLWCWRCYGQNLWTRSLWRISVDSSSVFSHSTLVQHRFSLQLVSISVSCVFSVNSITGLCVIFQMYTSPNIIFILCMMYNKEVQLSVLIRPGNHGCQHLWGLCCTSVHFVTKVVWAPLIGVAQEDCLVSNGTLLLRWSTDQLLLTPVIQAWRFISILAYYETGWLCWCQIGLISPDDLKRHRDAFFPMSDGIE